MIKRDYLKQLAEYDKQLTALYAVRSALVKQFKQTCPHPNKFLDVKRNSYEDEYGRTMESWTDFDYTCIRCGVTHYKHKNGRLNVKECRDLLNSKVKELK